MSATTDFVAAQKVNRAYGTTGLLPTLITDTRDGRQYVGKADGAETIRQRWTAYSSNGHGGNVELRNLDPSTFRFSLLRVFDPATPATVIDIAESHFKTALDTRRHGLNRN